MKILILNWRDTKHPLAGGAEISTHEHAKRWVREGHRVIQVSSFFKGADSEEIIDGVKIVRLGNHYTVHLLAFLYYLKNIRNKVDVVIDEFHFIPFFTPLYVGVKKVAFIHEIAGSTWFKNANFPINIIGYLLEPFFFILYRNIPFMTVSESTRRELIDLRIPSRNIYLIHNGLRSTSVVNKKEPRPTLIYLGRLAKDKGIEDAIDAFYKTRQNMEDIKLWIVGKEEKEGYLEELRNLTQKLCVDKDILFFDYVSDKKKFELLQKAWILVHPSIKEGWGLTVIEAASCRTPTIAYNVPGLCDSIINDKTGLLVDNKSPEEMANKILSLMRNPKEYAKLSSNALLWSKKFSWRKSTSESLRVIEKF